jgi:hypothetical protein
LSDGCGPAVPFEIPGGLRSFHRRNTNRPQGDIIFAETTLVMVPRCIGSTDPRTVLLSLNRSRCQRVNLIIRTELTPVDRLCIRFAALGTSGFSGVIHHGRARIS